MEPVRARAVAGRWGRGLETEADRLTAGDPPFTQVDPFCIQLPARVELPARGELPERDVVLAERLVAVDEEDFGVGRGDPEPFQLRTR